MSLNPKKIRKDFPLLGENLLNKKCIYMDSACMALKPAQVIDTVVEYYKEYPACSERSAHALAKKTTEKVEEARTSVKKFIGAKRDGEIIFTKNATESINLMANSLSISPSQGLPGLSKGDIVLGTDKEHNSNLVPWLLLAKRKEIIHDYVESSSENMFDIENFEEKLKTAKGKIKLVSVVHTSNIDGTTVPLKEIIKIAHENNAFVLVDAAQSVPHKEIDVKKLDADFVAFSGHKMLGPTGTGVLYGKYDLLEKLEPFLVGGSTVIETEYDSFELEKPPKKFEAGLKHYSGIIGLGAAVKYLKSAGLDNIAKHEVSLNKKITESLGEVGEISIIGPKDASLRSGIFSFNIKGMDQHLVAGLLDSSSNIMVRAGAHCAHSWFNAHNLKGSVRASLYLYNTEEECEMFVESVKKIIKLNR